MFRKVLECVGIFLRFKTHISAKSVHAAATLYITALYIIMTLYIMPLYIMVLY